MAAYCAISDVEGRVRGPAFSATTTPTLTEVTAMMADDYAEINAAIASHGLTVPVTAPASFLAWLVGVNADGSAATAAAVRFADTDGDNADRGVSLFEKRFQKAMERLWNGSAIPSGLSPSSAALPTSFSVQYPNTDPDLGTLRNSAYASDFEL